MENFSIFYWRPDFILWHLLLLLCRKGFTSFLYITNKGNKKDTSRKDYLRRMTNVKTWETQLGHGQRYQRFIICFLIIDTSMWFSINEIYNLLEWNLIVNELVFHFILFQFIIQFYNSNVISFFNARNTLHCTIKWGMRYTKS